MKKSFLSCLFLSVALSLSAQEFYEKHVKFPENASIEQKVDMASRLVPTAQQMEWQKMEFTAFLHFGINTFTGKEWGDGTESPAVFNPTELDCDQWVKALKDGGFRMAIITAKHHDGFCLWPTQTTDYSVKSSLWKDGKGDVVRELREACDKYGLKFGVYLSPWDRNADCYGDSPAYNKFFIQQLTELLTNYGEVHEVWFDGANGEGPNGKKQIYDWDAIMKTIRTLQPKAVTAIMGDDVRWVGNESGLGRDTEWSATVKRPGCYSTDSKLSSIGITSQSKDLGSRELLEKVDNLYWYPSEVDVSIRPGWFYHAEQDNQVRSVANLVDIYFKSVGCNSVLLLNIPPDRRGLIHETDVERIKGLSDYLKKTFSDNFILKGNELWQPQSGEQKVFSVKKGSTVNTLLLQEDISKGQRIEKFIVEAYLNGEWKFLTEGTTVGYKRLLKFSDLKTDKIRITVVSARNKANIINVGLYYAQNLQDNSVKVKLSDVDSKMWKSVGDDVSAAFDGKRETVCKFNSLKPVVIDLGETIGVSGFSYSPALGDDLSGTIFKYNFYVSKDGMNWNKCVSNGEFSNIMHNPIPYFVRFGKKFDARYIKLEPISEINGENKTSVSEIGILL
ncbi:MAG: alpha-L-fucosidase [Phocaeicola sp.]|nr:alpha-L-fucosidase [Phocaeicola sp.]